MLVSEGHTAAGAHTDLSDLHSTWGHGDIQARASAKGHVWVCDPAAVRVCVISMAHVTTGVIGTLHVEIRGLC